jgi:hypothetical protein
MRRSRRPNHSFQLNLFHPPRRGPEWRALPIEVREQTKLLLARLLRTSPVRESAVESESAASDE